MTAYLFPGFPGGRTGLALLVLRLVTGAAFILHGWPKIQNPMGWMGADVPIPGILQAAAAVAEFGGGIAWIVGGLTPLFSFLLVCTMAFATFLVHVGSGHPFIAGNRPGEPYQPGTELAAVYLAVSLLFLLAGPGQFSLDYCLFGRNRPTGPTA